MPERGDGFFHERRWGSVEEFTDRLFEVAYFWRLDPATLLSLPLDRFLLYERQAERIAEKQQPEKE